MATTVKPVSIIERPDYLRERLKALPESPGVYLMRDSQTRVIYVGKALSPAQPGAELFSGWQRAAGTHPSHGRARL